MHSHQQDSIKTKQTGVILRAVSVYQKNVNPRAETTHPYPQDPMKTQRMGINLSVVSTQQMDINLRAGSAQLMNANPRVVGIQWMDINPRASNAQRMNANPRVVSAKRMGVKSRAKIAHSNKKSPIWTRERVEDLSAIEEVLTIIRGPHKIGGNHNARDRYAKKAENPPQALAHKADMHYKRSAW